jgi:hypothetical protein
LEPTEDRSRIQRNRRPWLTPQRRGSMPQSLIEYAVDESPHRRYVFSSLCTCEAIGSWPSLLRCWRCAPGTSSSQGARHIPLKRTVLRHAKLSKIFRESFDLVGNLPDLMRSLIGDLDPKGPIHPPRTLTGTRDATPSAVPLRRASYARAYMARTRSLVMYDPCAFFSRLSKTGNWSRTYDNSSTESP